MVQLRKTVCQFLIKLIFISLDKQTKTYLLIFTMTWKFHIQYFSKEMKTFVLKEICTRLFREALFTIALS